MDKQLKKLKSQLEKEIPTKFTDEDKKAIMRQIKYDPYPKKRNWRPTIIVIASIAALFVVVFLSTNGLLPVLENRDSAFDNSIEAEFEAEMYNESSNDDSSFEDHSGNDRSEEEIIQDEADVEQNIANNPANILFNPNSVKIGLTYGNMEVNDVQHDGNQTIVTFHGDTILSGDFYVDDGQIAFHPDHRTLLDFPLARPDKDGNIPFYFTNENLINIMYGATRAGESINETGQGFVINVTEIQYIYSPNGSSVHLKILQSSDIKENHFQTTIELEDELVTIYERYTETFDDSLLQELEPIDVFKLFYHAIYYNNEEVEYALFIQNKNEATPNKESYFNNREHYEPNKKVVEELYPKLSNETMFKDIRTVSEGQELAFVMFQLNENNWPNNVVLVKDTERDVWKVLPKHQN